MSQPGRTIAGAVLAAVMTGIIINAMLLQRSHRLAPVEPPALQSAAVKVPAAAAPEPTAAPASVENAPAPALPPARPADLGALIEATVAPTRSADPIRDLLRTDTSGRDGEARKLTMAAQAALIKLGFPVKADGVAGASTQQAVQQFERAHGFAPTGEITPKLVRQLTAAANAPAH